MPMFNSSYRGLANAYEKLEVHKSHLEFVKACLRNNMIPWGLRIKLVPSVPDEAADLKSDLMDRWNEMLRKAPQLLLRHLK